MGVAWNLHAPSKWPLENQGYVTSVTGFPGEWEHRKWQSVPAELDQGKNMVTATLPEGVTVYYFSLIDDRGLIVSSEHDVLNP